MNFIHVIVLAALFYRHYAHAAQPHIIFIMADDLGWNDVGFHGSLQIPTPNIDALAYSGVILNNYYVQPICTPSRSALMTGFHPANTGMQHATIAAAEPYGVPLNLTFLPTRLNALGYTSRIVGKWHLGMYEKEFTPTYRGFASHYGYWTGRHDYYDHTALAHPGYWGYDFRRNMDVETKAFGHYTTDLLTEEACSLISSHNNTQPLFLYLAHLAVHSGNCYNPLEAPAELVDRFSYIEDMPRRKFAAMLTKLDESVGKVVQALAENSMLENSIIIFSTDNGGPAAGFNLNAASNWPFRGTKATVWEGGVRAAGVLWSPLIKQNLAGTVSMKMIQVMDWYPTLIAAAGGDPSELPKTDGLNMWPVFVDDAASPRKEMLHNIDPISGQYSLRMGDWKITAHANAGYGNQWDGWFGPSGRNDSDLKDADRMEVASDKYKTQLFRKKELKDFPVGRKKGRQYLRKHKELWSVWKSFKSVLRSPAGKAVKKINPSVFRKIHLTRIKSEVLCDPIPLNATQHCNDAEHPCLFHIPSDPCEYHDVSKDHPRIVTSMKERLAQYNKTVVYPLKVKGDPMANPVFWNHTWTDWKDYPPPQGGAVNATVPPCATLAADHVWM